MPHPTVQTLAPHLQQFFHETANRLAHETHFVQRRSKMTGALFAQTWVIGKAAHPQASLSELSDVAADLGVSISPQGLDERLTPAAVDFFKQLFAAALQHFRARSPLAVPLLQQFSAVYLHDSSVIALPDALQAEFAGCGGNGPVASLKLQLCFEFLRGQLHGLRVEAGRRADAISAEQLQHLPARSLHLQDLGYHDLQDFQTIAHADAYFLSRLQVQTALFESVSGVPLDLWPALRHEPRVLFEREVLLGARTRLASRLIVARVPKTVAAARRRKAKHAARLRGRTLRQRTLRLLDWSLFITNVPPALLTTEQIPLLYGVRWQVELLFKLCKSLCGLAQIGEWRRERVLCELYAKLMGVVLLHWLLAPLRFGECELSIVKACRLWQQHAHRLACDLSDWRVVRQVLRTLRQRWQRLALKAKRPSRLTTLQTLQAQTVGGYA